MDVITLPDLGSLIEILEVPLPDLQYVAAENVPEPYHHLLVHEGDMTRRLEQYYESPVHLSTLKVLHEPGSLFRQVLLQTDDMRTVEFGAIHIHLDKFQGGALQAVLGCFQPLGGILNAYSMYFRSRLSGFVTIHAEDALAGILGLEEDARLYGRINSLVDAQGETIADVIELLPPKGSGLRKQALGVQFSQ